MSYGNEGRRREKREEVDKVDVTKFGEMTLIYKPKETKII